MDDPPLFPRRKKVVTRVIEGRNKSFRNHRNEKGISRDLGHNFPGKFRRRTRKRRADRHEKESRFEIDIEDVEEETGFEEQPPLIFQLINRHYNDYNDDAYTNDWGDSEYDYDY